MLDYITLNLNFFDDLPIAKLRMDRKHQEIVISLVLLTMMCRNIDTRKDQKPYLELSDMDVLAFYLKEPKDVIESVINNKELFRIEEDNDSRKFLCSEYADKFYQKLKEESDRQRARRLTKSKQNSTSNKSKYDVLKHLDLDSNPFDFLNAKPNEKPTLEEIKSYCLKKGYGENFIDPKLDYEYIVKKGNWREEIDRMANSRPS